MQPPPRKVKITQVLRNVQNEQLSRIHAKHQSDLDILDDIREFAKQRSIIERVCAQSLQKLVAQFQQKREGAKDVEISDENKEHRSIATVWKNLLNEMDKVARLRLTSADTYSSQVAERAKVERLAKVQRMKRVEEIISLNHEEMYSSVHEMTKAKKSYVEVERIAQEVKEKALEAENRLKKGTVRFYQSRSNLEKTCAKLTSRSDACEKRSCHARNEYLLALGAANAHQVRYHTIDLKELLNTLDGDFYKKIKNYLSILSTTEVETNVFSRTCFEKVLAESEMIAREYQLKIFLQDNLVFTKMLQYHFDPVENDNIDSVVIDEMEALYLDREARKWATNVARDSKTIEDITKMIENIKRIDGAQKDLSRKGSSESVTITNNKDGLWKLNDLKEALRKAETSKVKAEAKLEILRAAGVDVDQWLNSAYEALTKEAEAEAQARLQSITSSPGMDSTFDDSYVTNNNDSQHSRTSSLLAHDGPKSFRCSALYTYEAQRDDELTIHEAEKLEVLEDSEGDGWIKAKNAEGAIGYIPETYILKDTHSTDQPKDDYSISSSAHIVPSSSSSSLAADSEVLGITHNTSKQRVCMAKAVFDYTGESSEELSFQEGDIIKIIRKDENGVDDGFWEGECNGHVGVFPSLLVEEIGGSDDSQSSESPEPIFSPPGFEPPNLPLPPSPLLPQEVPNAIYTEIDHSSTTDSVESSSPPFASPPSFYPPQMPTKSVAPKKVLLKPARAAPPPPKAKKQNSVESPPPPPPVSPPIMDNEYFPPPPMEMLYDQV
ncbi:F-BAR and double SH3 domains protein 2-like [Antedon mediterranea]|uniref:F-BAR and double SH3 domains protein 2-like n=1 Tax=Antedon mediterranea TaxID=105859 RepID=UPI003AF6612C